MITVQFIILRLSVEDLSLLDVSIITDFGSGIV